MSLSAYFKRSEFQNVFFSAFRESTFLLEDIVNIRNKCLIFLRSWEMNLGEAVTNLPRTAAVHGICHVPRPSSFPMNAEKRHLFLN